MGLDLPLQEGPTRPTLLFSHYGGRWAQRGQTGPRKFTVENSFFFCVSWSTVD